MPFSDLNQLLSFLNTALITATTAGTIAAFRSGRVRGEAEQFITTLTALQAEIAALKDKIVRLEASNERLRNTISAMRIALRQRGFNVLIEPDTITITDMSGRQTQTAVHPPTGQDGSLKDR
jgi:uncharacterized small protein (DUF1192 family)